MLFFLPSGDVDVVSAQAGRIGSLTHRNSISIRELLMSLSCYIQGVDVSSSLAVIQAQAMVGLRERAD